MQPLDPHRVGPIVLAALLVTVPVSAAVSPTAIHRDAAVDGAERLLNVQHGNGSFPLVVGEPGVDPAAQGITGQGFHAAFAVSGDEDYIGNGPDGAAGTRAWVGAWLADNPSAFVAPANVYFLAEHALLTGDPEDMSLARDALQRDLALADDGDSSNGPPGADLARDRIVHWKAQGLGPVGLWEVAHLVRAAHDLGDLEVSEEIATVLANQDLVDPFQERPFHTLGLAGLLFGLAENNTAAAPEVVAEAHASLAEEQDLDGRVLDPNGQSLQPTAYAAIGFTAVGDVALAHLACDWLEEAQDPYTGRWIDVAGDEFVPAESEAVQGLAACTLPARNGATTFADAARAAYGDPDRRLPAP